MNEKKYTIELTEDEKDILEEALYCAKVEYEQKGLEERRKESGSGIHMAVADQLMNKAYKFCKLFLKVTDVKFPNI